MEQPQLQNKQGEEVLPPTQPKRGIVAWFDRVAGERPKGYKESDESGNTRNQQQEQISEPKKPFTILRGVKSTGRLVAQSLGKLAKAIDTAHAAFAAYDEKRYDQIPEPQNPTQGTVIRYPASRLVRPVVHPEQTPTREEFLTPPQPKSSEEVARRLTVMEAVTQQKKASVLERLGTFGKKLHNKLTEGATYLHTNVDAKTKLFAYGGLCLSGLLSATAAPAVVTAIGTAALGMRVVSAAGTYTALRKVLDTNYKTWEEKDRRIGTFKKVALEGGAILTAAGAGHMVGQLFEWFMNLPILENIEESISTVMSPDMEIRGRGGLTDPGVRGTLDSTFLRDMMHIQPLEDMNTTPSIQETLPEIVHTDIVHTIQKGDSLWSVLRKTLETNNIEGFRELTSQAKEGKIRTLIETIAQNPKEYGISSGDINLLRVGDTLTIKDLTH